MKQIWIASLALIAFTFVGLAADITITGGGATITNGGTITFGNVNIGTQFDTTLTIENQEADTLHFTTPFTVVGSGDFTVLTQPATDSIVGTDVLTFVVRFTPSCIGAKSGSISIINDDPADNPYVINFSGSAVDVTDPVALCTNATIQLNASGSASVNAATINNGSSDNCTATPILSLSGTTSFGCNNLGLNASAVTLTVTDASGNSDQCFANVTVQDVTPPTASCETNITIELDALGQATIDSSDISTGTFDNCSIATYSASISSFDCDDIGVHSVTSTFTDIAGNTATCITSVNVEDNLAPNAECNNVIIQLNSSGLASTNLAAINNGSNDNCTASPILSLTGTTSFDCNNLGLNASAITLTVTDDEGNSDQCFANVTVQDNIDPIVSCQDSINVNLDATGNVTVNSTQIDLGTTDNCSIAGAALNTPNFTCSDIGFNTVTTTFTDIVGNTETCQTVVNIRDLTNPIARCKANPTFYLDDDGEFVLSALNIDSSSSDACGIATRALTQNLFDCSDAGTTTFVTMTVTDNNGRQNSCFSSVLIEDTVSPQAECVASFTLSLDNTGNGTLLTTDLDNGSTDACTPLSYSLSKTAFVCADIGAPQLVTLTVTDDNSNSSQCSSLVLVSDTEAPEALCKADTVYLNATGNGSTNTAEIDNGSNDACGIDALSLDVQDFSCSEIGVNVVNLTVEDNNGNTNTCSANVTVVDTISPIALCQPVTVILDASGNATTSVVDVDNGSNDICSNVTVSLNDSTFTCDDVVPTTTITLTAEDEYGNSTTCQSIVTVEDTIKPTIVCPANIERCITDNVVNYATPTGTDNCTSNITYSGVFGQGASFNVGTNTETWINTDIDGNTATCSFDIVVYDVPTVSDPGADETICDTLYTLQGNTPAVGIGQWTLVSTNATLTDSLDANSDVTDVEVGDNEFTWTISNGVCPVSENTVTISRDDFPTQAVVGNDTNICNVNAATLKGNTPIVGTGLWALLNGDGSPDNPNDPITSAVVVGINSNEFTWTISNGVCPVTIDTMAIIRDQNPSTANAGTNQPVCDDEFDLEATIPAIGIGTWSVISGNGDFDDVNDANTEVEDLIIGTNILLWTVTNGSCPASLDSVEITTTEEVPNSFIPTSKIIRVCQDTITLDAIPLPFGTGQWLKTGPGVVDNDLDPNSIAYDLTDGPNTTTTFLWLVTNGICPTKSYSLQVIRDNQVSEAMAGDDQEICFDSVTFMNAVEPEVGTGNWSVISGGGTITSITDDSTEVKNLTKGENIFVWEITATSCTESRDTVSIFRDGTPPTIDCPNDTTLPNDPGLCGAEYHYLRPLGEDNCPDPITSLIAGLDSGDVFDIGTTIVTYQVKDIFEDSASCTFEVTVEDTQNPIITCQDTIQRNTDLGVCGHVLTGYIEPVGIDNCPGVNTIRTDGFAGILGPDSLFPTGTTVLEYFATDAAGNQNSCTTTIIIEDREDPVVTGCPGNFTLDIDPNICGRTVTWGTPVALDNCQDSTILNTINVGYTVTGIPSGNFFESGQSTISYVYRDANGNETNCQFFVRVRDTIDPIITCTDDTVRFSTDPGVCEAEVTYATPTSDNFCTDDSVFLASGQLSGTIFPTDTTINTWIAQDNEGNTDQCTVVVIVTDDEEPLFTNCPSLPPFATEDSVCYAILDFPTLKATDNCSADAFISIVQTDVTGISLGDTIFSGAPYEFEYTATDEAGNSSTCEFEIEVIDNQTPIIVCRDTVKDFATSSLCGKRVLFNNPLASSFDNCGIQSVVNTSISGLATGDTFPVGTTVLQYTATDAEGNSAVCSFPVIIEDTINPVIVCGPAIVEDNEIDNCSKVVSIDIPTATDNCTSLPTISTISPLGDGDEFEIGTTTVTFEAIDEYGNSDRCTITVTVNDTQSPTIQNPTDLIVNTDSNSCTAAVTYNLPNASDNCDSVRIVKLSGPANGANFPLGVTTLTFVAIDSAGNRSDTVDLQVTVNDTELPLITCPASITQVNDLGLCAASVNYVDPTLSASDNCTIDTTFLSSDPLFQSDSLFPVGTTSLSYSVVDESGNDSTCSFSITVVDSEPPVITCSSDTTINNATGSCVAIFSYPTPAATDICTTNPTVTRTSGFASGTLFPIGTTTIEYQATDDVGNTATCTFEVTVEDVQAPVIDCPEALTFANDPGQCGATATFADPIATDNCTDFAVTRTGNFSFVSGSLFPLGSTLLPFVATDSAGNVSDTCYLEIIVEDREAPSLSCDTSRTLCAPAIVNYNDAVVISDNCTSLTDMAATRTTNSQAPNTFFDFGSYTIRYEATDSAGNIGSCSFNITVYDTTVVAFAGTDTSICDDNFILQGSDPGFSDGQWTVISGAASFTNSTDPNDSIFDIAEGETRLRWTVTSGPCKVQFDNVVITRFIEPGATFAGKDTILCSVPSYSLNADSADIGIGTWTVKSSNGSFVDSTDESTIVDSMNLGLNEFYWTVQNGVCPVQRDSVRITVSENPSFELTGDSSIYISESLPLFVDIDSIGLYNFDWSPALDLDNPFSHNPEASPDSTTEFFVTVTNANGCQTTDSTTLTVINDILIFTGFTPDGDGVNDTWVIRGSGGFPDMYVEIYTPWGKQVLSSEPGYPEAWDGRFNGKDMPFGTYYFVVDKKNGSNPRKGSVTILK